VGAERLGLHLVQRKIGARLTALEPTSVKETHHSSRLVRFGVFEVDLQAGELRKSGVKLKLAGQPFQVLTILLEHPDEVVTREELQKLWPDFVDAEHNLNTAINKIRDVLGDSAENPRFIETLPRRGYRFVVPVNGIPASLGAWKTQGTEAVGPAESPNRHVRRRLLAYLAGAIALVLLSSVVLMLQYRRPSRLTPRPRALTRITFDPGLQIGATWSPDGRFVAYSSDRGGKFDIWVQQVTGGDPVQVTHGPGQNWQPDWSPDGKYIAYRSEREEQGIYIIPALGGAGLERKITSYGYKPKWSPDSSQILLQRDFTFLSTNKFYVVRLDGTPPREIVSNLVAKENLWPGLAVWRPGTEKVSFWVGDPGPSPSFWVVSISGLDGMRIAVTPEVENELREVALEGVSWEHPGDFSFAWSPLGKAVYFERSYRGARNIWKMTLDPQRFHGTAVERLTAGPGPDTGLAVSPDGQKLAFTSKSERIRSWLFPLDPNSGRLRGEGRSVSSASIVAWEQALSPDGKKIAFTGYRSGKAELWEKQLADEPESPVIADGNERRYAQWSPDNKRLAYSRVCREGRLQIMLWSVETRSEQPLTSCVNDILPFDWSPDGEHLLAIQRDSKTRREEVWLVPVAAAPHAETAAEKLISDRARDLFQPHFSPDGRWIAFEAVADLPTTVESRLYLMSASGGAWTPITDGKQWTDKPRWASDGKTIYFVAQDNGFFNVWGQRFNSSAGKPVGAPFRVTSFHNSKMMIPVQIPAVALSLTRDHLLLTIEEVSGSVWVLDNVDQ